MEKRRVTMENKELQWLTSLYEVPPLPMALCLHTHTDLLVFLKCSRLSPAGFLRFSLCLKCSFFKS